MYGGGVGVVINFEKNSKKCNFEECKCNDNHVCTGVEERDACVEMALKMLGVKDNGDFEEKNIR